MFSIFGISIVWILFERFGSFSFLGSDVVVSMFTEISKLTKNFTNKKIQNLYKNFTIFFSKLTNNFQNFKILRKVSIFYKKILQKKFQNFTKSFNILQKKFQNSNFQMFPKFPKKVSNFYLFQNFQKKTNLASSVVLFRYRRLSLLSRDFDLPSSESSNSITSSVESI